MVGRPISPRHPRTQTPPLPQGGAALRGLQPPLLLSHRHWQERPPLPLLLLPGHPTSRPWRLSPTPHLRRPPGKPGRTALRANPTPPPLAHRTPPPSRLRSTPARATPPRSTSSLTVNCWAWKANAASCWRPTTPTPSTWACSAKNRAESASGPGLLKPAAAPSQQTWANGGPSWRPLGGSPPTVAPPTATPTHPHCGGAQYLVFELHRAPRTPLNAGGCGFGCCPTLAIAG